MGAISQDYERIFKVTSSTSQRELRGLYSHSCLFTLDSKLEASNFENGPAKNWWGVGFENFWLSNQSHVYLDGTYAAIGLVPPLNSQ